MTLWYRAPEILLGTLFLKNTVPISFLSVRASVENNIYMSRDQHDATLLRPLQEASTTPRRVRWGVSVIGGL